uniref:Uncharacterized protein n=1 Tax=Parascaris equorum TaxID=6256 RepID=A0A914S7B7_PAREQ
MGYMGFMHWRNVWIPAVLPVRAYIPQQGAGFVLHFEIESTGFATAMPYIFSMIIKICTGPLSDHAPCMSEKARVMMFTFISQGLSNDHYCSICAQLRINSFSYRQTKFTENH